MARTPLVAVGLLSRRAVRRADVRLFWHPQGDYLAVQVDRFTKTRKSTYTSFELFSVKERDIPMEARPFFSVHTAYEHSRSACSGVRAGMVDAKQHASNLGWRTGAAAAQHGCCIGM